MTPPTDTQEQTPAPWEFQTKLLYYFFMSNNKSNLHSERPFRFWVSKMCVVINPCNSIGFMLQKLNIHAIKKNEIFVKLTKEDLWWYVLREMGCFWNSSNQLLYNKFIQCECHLPPHPSLSLSRTPTYTFPHTPFWTLLFLLASQFLQWGKQTYNRPAKGQLIHSFINELSNQLINSLIN